MYTDFEWIFDAYSSQIYNSNTVRMFVRLFVFGGLKILVLNQAAHKMVYTHVTKKRSNKPESMQCDTDKTCCHHQNEIVAQEKGSVNHQRDNFKMSRKIMV